MKISSILYQLGDRFLKLRVYDLSAQMAYYFLMSIFPFLLVIYSLLPYLPLKEDYMLELVKPFAPKGTYHLIENTLSYTLVNQKKNLLSFSLVITLWLSSMGFQCIKRILNDAYAIQGKENVLKQVIEGLLLTIGFMIAILISVVVPVFERVMRHYLGGVFSIERFQNLWIFIQWGIGSLFIVSFFIGLYYFAPNIKLRIVNVLPGAIFSTIGWQIVSLGFASYVSQNNYSAVYGQLGSIVVLMLWFYLSAMIIIIGGLLNTIVHPAQSDQE
ncbi:YihY/virulence factor BrkB family protein [Pseudalkalibacillus decolorationis]|uniref:YihY/virulence factor BrkB family protein n=1 Tax=Pseudalkalibacillus decolorationis TaxID=163879 RepID=UPI0021478B2C|nr:YihY/virulence factor BrkB family protein [Pseudalkalibacillus decolorationis]